MARRPASRWSRGNLIAYWAIALAIWVASVALAGSLDSGNRPVATAIVLVASTLAVVGFVAVVVRLMRQ